MRYPEFATNTVFIGVDSSYCIFNVESVSPKSRPPERLVQSALTIMIQKCQHYIAIMLTPNFGEVEDLSKMSTEEIALVCYFCK